jgi:hypothetical protein
MDIDKKEESGIWYIILGILIYLYISMLFSHYRLY